MPVICADSTSGCTYLLISLRDYVLLCCAKGEMDLGELEEELETTEEEEEKQEEKTDETNESVDQLPPPRPTVADEHNSQLEANASTAEQDARRAAGDASQSNKRIEERLVEPTEPVEDVTQTAEPVAGREEVESVAPVEEQDAAVIEAGVAPLPEGVDDLYERQGREALRLWEEQQQAQRERERARQEEEEAASKQQRKDMETIIRHAMTAIHK